MNSNNHINVTLNGILHRIPQFKSSNRGLKNGSIELFAASVSALSASGIE